MLAEKVISDLLPGSEVDTNFTESAASCEFLVDKFQWPESTLAITCDIGGATCDIALAIVEAKLGFNVYPIAVSGTHAVCVQKIDQLFDEIVEESLRHGVSKTLGSNLSEDTAWSRARHSFDGSSGAVLTVHQDLGKFEDPETGISFNGSEVTISRCITFRKLLDASG